MLGFKLGYFVRNKTNNNYFLQVAPDVDDVFEACSWRGYGVKCEDIFKVALTSEGVCFNFNALAASEMFSDK